MFRNFAFIVLGFVASALLTEALLRSLPVSTGYGYMPVNADSPILTGTPGSPYVYSLGWNFRRVSRGTLNNEGFIANRPYVRNVSGGVLIVGDSYLQAAAIPAELNLHAQLAKRLPETNIVGLSRAGGALPDYIEIVRWGESHYKPAIVVILAVGGDVMDSLTPRAGGYYFSDEKSGMVLRRFDRGELSQTQQALNQSMLFRYVYDNLAFTVNFPERPQLPIVAALHNEQRDLQYDKISQFFLDQLASIVPVKNVILVTHRGRHGGKFIYDSDVNVLLEVARSRGYRVMDLGPKFTEFERRTRQRLDASPVDTHWNALAHEYVAEELLPIVRPMLRESAVNE